MRVVPAQLQQADLWLRLLSKLGFQNANLIHSASQDGRIFLAYLQTRASELGINVRFYVTPCLSLLFCMLSLSKLYMNKNIYFSLPVSREIVVLENCL